MTVRVLLVGLESWQSTARLPGALAKAGFDVGLLSEPGNLAYHSRYVDQRFLLDVPALHRGDVRSVTAAAEAFQPALIVPGDARAVRILNFIVGDHASRTSPAVRAMVERSIGRPFSGGHGSLRGKTLDLADRLGIATAPHAPAQTQDKLLAFADRHGWPVYLKRDHTYGGLGVRLCSDRASAITAHSDFSREHKLTTPRGLWRRLRRRYEELRHGPSPLALPLGTGTISVEGAIPGTPAFYTGVAMDGRVLAGFAAEVLAFEPPNGPSTRVRLHHDADMQQAATRMVDAMGLSGFFGLDFIARPDGAHVFLEFNGRPSTVCHLGGLVSADLCAALYSAVTGRAIAAAEPGREAKVALFPQDWIRAPRANDRNQFWLDIPRDDPPLLEQLNKRLPAGIEHPMAATSGTLSPGRT